MQWFSQGHGFAVLIVVVSNPLVAPDNQNPSHAASALSYNRGNLELMAL
jgi:hypothetical protein